MPGPCEPEDLIDGIIFAANYLGSTQLLSERNPSKNIRMMQAQEAVSRVKVQNPNLCISILFWCGSQASCLDGADADFSVENEMRWDLFVYTPGLVD